jgi:hypothetical protein
MRFLRVRLTVWRLLAVVAGVGALAGGGIAEGRRRQAYFERLDYHLQQMEGAGGPYGMFHQLPPDAKERLVRAWVYHARMWQRYKDALAIPFRYLPPDPPEPD